MVKENYNCIMEIILKENGMKICLTVRLFKNFRMEIDMKVSIIMIKSMGLECFIGLLEKSMKEIGKMISSAVREFIIFQMDMFMKENGSIISICAKVLFSLKTAISIEYSFLS